MSSGQVKLNFTVSPTDLPLILKNKYSKPISEINLTSLNYDSDCIWVKMNDHKVENPYTLLPPIFENVASNKKKINSISGIKNISDGGAALTAYSKLQFVDMSLEERTSIKKSLLRYCELDTLAMVRIFEFMEEL